MFEFDNGISRMSFTPLEPNIQQVVQVEVDVRQMDDVLDVVPFMDGDYVSDVRDGSTDTDGDFNRMEMDAVTN